MPQERLWGAQTERCKELFGIGEDRMPYEMVLAYATLKKGCALVNAQDGRLAQSKCELICTVCDELLAGKHAEEFPLCVWISGSGTQFNMNVNEVIANRISQLVSKPLGSKDPLHPNDDVNMSQSSNDTFPAAMHIATAQSAVHGLIPSLTELKEGLDQKARMWQGIVKIGRTHLQDATPLTLGQEFSGYAAMLEEHLTRLQSSLKGVYALALGGTAVGTGINTLPGFDERAAEAIAKLTKLPFVTASNKFAVQGAHDALVHFMATLKTLACSLYKIVSDIAMLSCGPRAGIFELILPSNEPGSSIMPGKVNPTQCEALAMMCVHVMGADAAVAFAGASGSLEMNVYKPVMIFNILHSLRILKEGMRNFNRNLVQGMEPNLEKIEEDVSRSLMLVTALCPHIGYDQASKLAKHAFEKGITLRQAVEELHLMPLDAFDALMRPEKMCKPNVHREGN